MSIEETYLRMIKNEREYKITKASLDKFQAALTQLNKLREQGTQEPAKLKLQEAAVKSMLNELKEQLSAASFRKISEIASVLREANQRESR